MKDTIHLDHINFNVFSNHELLKKDNNSLL